MHIDLPEETKALRDELRAYLTTIMTPELAEELRHLDAGAGGEEHAKALEKIAADGWLGMGWPKEFGGQGRSAIDQYVFFEEFQRVGFPFPILTICLWKEDLLSRPWVLRANVTPASCNLAGPAAASR